MMGQLHLFDITRLPGYLALSLRSEFKGWVRDGRFCMAVNIAGTSIGHIFVVDTARSKVVRLREHTVLGRHADGQSTRYNERRSLKIAESSAELKRLRSVQDVF